jgi:hypothetical protein
VADGGVLGSRSQVRNLDRLSFSPRKMSCGRAALYPRTTTINSTYSAIVLAVVPVSVLLRKYPWRVFRSELVEVGKEFVHERVRPGNWFQLEQT